MVSESGHSGAKRGKLSLEQTKVEGQRAAIREHVAKYLAYEDQAKNMALRTIRNAQGYIEKIRAKATSIRGSWEDFWDPENPAPEGYEPPEEFQARRAVGYVEPPLEAEEETRIEGEPAFEPRPED